ncbi:helix-turn-helix domain-containing protein [Bradyrhizobium sp. STM 3562]|uniref:helix-turn-helix domain-containing protein n=1 Tax=Bradyrhizobium sp. STM 3562 TaxID=578924 RepID=UPI00388DECEF
MPSVSPRALFALNLRRLRLATGLSQEALAERAGLHRTYVSSIERGERNVSLDNIFRLAEALAADPRDLLAPERKAGSK